MGWTRPEGPPLPVFCPNCKAIFPSKNYVFSGPFFNAWNNEEECILCNFAGAQLSQGVFDLSSEVVRVLSAPDMTYPMLEAIKDIADELAQGKVDLEQASRRISNISPSLFDLLQKAAVKGVAFVFFVAAVAGMGANYLTYVDHEQHKIERQEDLQGRYQEQIEHQRERQEDLEQLRLERASEAGRDHTLERILDALSAIHADEHGLSENAEIGTKEDTNSTTAAGPEIQKFVQRPTSHEHRHAVPEDRNY